MLGDIIKTEFKRGLWPKVAAVFAAPVLLDSKKVTTAATTELHCLG